MGLRGRSFVKKREVRSERRYEELFENLAVYHRSLEVALKIMRIIDDVRHFNRLNKLFHPLPSNISEVLEGGQLKISLDF
jgi:hypothetical protein